MPAAAVATLVERYGALVRRAVRRVAGARADTLADDVSQVVMTAIWRQLAREQVIDAPSSYIYRAAIRETVRAVRRESNRAETPLDETQERAASDGDPHRALHGREVAAAIEQAIAGLQRERQQAVRAHLSGLAVDEVMSLHGWSYQRARNLIARGMGDLRQALRQRGIP